MPTKRALIMHSADNVATAIDEIEPGDEVAARLGKEILTLEAIEKIPSASRYPTKYLEGWNHQEIW